MTSAPQSSRRRLHESFFGLFGGPLAWFLQFCAGYALASEPCFRAGERLAAPLPVLQWTFLAMILLTAAASGVALLALLVSWRTYREVSDSPSPHRMDIPLGRARFLSLWGVLLGGGFAVASALTGAAFLTLPRCAG